MAPRRVFLGTLAAIVAGLVVGWPRTGAPGEGLDLPRAQALVETMAAAPRPSGSDHHRQVVDLLEARLAATGLPVRREEGRGLVNLVAGGPDAHVWLVAHTDSVAAGPGAADDAFGVAVVVGVAEALGAPPGLGVLLTDGEEDGLLGAALHLERARPPVVLNVEARGTEGPVYMFQTAGPAPVLLERWQASGCDAQATSLARAVYELLPNDTDFTRFREAGAWGYDFALIRGAWRYHTAEDSAENLDPAALVQAGRCVRALAEAWLAAPRAEGVDDAPIVYAQLGGRTVVLPALLVRGLGLLTVLLAARRLRGWGGPILVGTGVLTAGAGTLLLFAWSWLRPDFWQRPAEMVAPEAAWTSAAALGGGLLAGLAWLGRRHLRGWHGTYGLAAGVAASVVPEAGYLLLPGALAGLAPGGWRWPLALLAGALLAPLLYALSPALTSRALPILALVPLVALAWVVPAPAGGAAGEGPGR